MKMNAKWLFPGMISLLLMQPGVGVADELDVDKMLQELEQELQMSHERFERARPKLRESLENKRQEFSSALDSALDQGFIELEKLGDRYAEVTEQSSEQLRLFMESDEVAQLKEFLSRLDEQALRERRDELVHQFSEVLELSKEQVEKLKPILRDELERLGRILDRYLHQSQKDFEQFRREFEAERDQGTERVRGILNPDQLRKFENQLDTIRQSVRKEVFDV